MLWKINAAFPSVIWQIYDWYLEPNAGYYFEQNACEPVHVQLNVLDNTVTVLNRTYHPYPNLTVQADVYDLDSKLLFHQEEKVSLSATDVKDLFTLSKVLDDKRGVNFVVLNLKDNSGKLVSHNVYWLSADNDYKALNTMPRTQVQATVLKSERGDSEAIWTLKLTNNSGKLAFFIRPQLISDGKEVAPCFWSASYFSLAPGETITVSASVPAGRLKDKNREIWIEGWNIGRQVISLNDQKN
jgi:hypothetical protein